MNGRILGMAWLALAALSARAGELTMIAPADQIMPLAQFSNDAISGGILKELGDKLAARLGRHARYVTVAGDKVGQVLQQGKADGVCYVLPFWIDGDFDWSAPFLPDAELLAARDDAPVLRAITDLRDKPVGTVLSYRYPRIAQVLGPHFKRDDAATMEQNLQRLSAGKVQYTIIGQLNMAYQMRANHIALRSDIVFASFKAQCAFSRKAQLPFSQVDVALKALVADGSVERILARYR